MSSVKVAVRVRPFNNREIQNKAECIIRMEDQTKTSKFENKKIPCVKCHGKNLTPFFLSETNT